MKPANLTSRLLTRKGQASPTLVAPPHPTSATANLPLLRPKPPELLAEPMLGGLDLSRHLTVPRAVFDRRVHMSLRLDPGRHVRLRLEATRRGRSMHSLLIEALDDLLARDDSPRRANGFPADHGQDRGDHGSRREPSRTHGAESDGGTSRSQ